ncbi:FliG C-terminal domain-containing protein [Treponema sp. R6D11]
MNRDEFNEEYYKVAERMFSFIYTAKKEGILALEDEIDVEKFKQRDVLELGFRLTVDGTDYSIIDNILSLIIEQEEDKYARLLMEIKKEAVLGIQSGENPWITACLINAHTDNKLSEDPIIQKFIKKEDDVPHNNGPLSDEEIKALLAGVDEKTYKQKYIKTPSNPFKKMITSCDDRAIQKIMREIDFQELAKALKSVDLEIRNKIFKNMSVRASTILIEEIDYMGPVRLKDVDESQEHIYKIYLHLIDTGEIVRCFEPTSDDFINKDNIENNYEGLDSSQIDTNAFYGIQEFTTFITKYPQEEEPYGNFPPEVLKDIPICRYFGSENGEKNLVDIEQKNKEQGMGNIQIPKTKIKLINYSVCPKCGRVFSFKDLLDYYANPKADKLFEDRAKQYREDTRFFCHDCETWFFPSLVIIDETPKSEVQFLSIVQTSNAIEEFYSQNGKNVLTRKKDNIIKQRRGEKIFKAVRNDVILKQLSPKPALISNLIQYTPESMMLNLINGTNYGRGDVLFGVMQEQRRQENDS